MSIIKKSAFGILPLLVSFAVVIGLASSTVAAEKFLRVERDFSQQGSSFVGWVPDQVIVQFNDYMPATSMRKGAGSNSVKFADDQLDAISAKFEFVNVERQFKSAKVPLGSEGVDLTRHYKVTFLSGADPLEVVQDFLNDASVATAEPIGIHWMSAAPDDFYFDGVNPDFPYNQWHYWAANSIDADQAWDSQTGSDAIKVGILDSGVRYFHEDLGGSNPPGPNDNSTNGNIWTNPGEVPGNGVDDDGNGYVDDVVGWDFIQSAGGGGVKCVDQDCTGQDNDPDDGNGHGTHVAGTVSAITNNNNRVAGVAGGWADAAGNANGVELIPCRIGYNGTYRGQTGGFVDMAAAAEAMNYIADLVDAGQNVASINCSWGSSNSGGLGAAATNLLSKGVMIVVAAGNSNTSSASYLGSRGDCMDVAATDPNGNGASFSSYGSWVDVAAPGVDILSTFANPDDPDLNNHYISLMDGTSMSAPHVAGIAGLLRSCNPNITLAQMTSAIVNNTTPYSDSRDLGSGIANANLALAAASCASCSETTPVADFSGSPTSGDRILNVNFSDLSTNNPNSWSWDFGDGGNSTSQNPSHAYNTAGTYTVSLTASNCAGADGNTKVSYITVTDPPCTESVPVAGFNASPTSGDAPLNVNFTDASTNSPDTWTWDFGDGNGSNSQNPSHSYGSAGTYSVTLTAGNCAGSDGATQTNLISVTNPPQADLHVHSIVVTRQSKGPNTNGRGEITIMDDNHNPVANANVTITATPSPGGTGTAATNSSGVVAFTTGKTRNPPSEWCFEVTSVTHGTLTYNQSKNEMTQVCENSGVVYGDEVGAIFSETVRPEVFSVSQNYPNPFNPTTKIEINVPRAEHVTVEIYNMLGQKVVTLMEATVSAGLHTVQWDASSNSSGMYLYVVKYGAESVTRKMVLLK